ncbi:MAG: hypothetical protein ABI625_24355 [bacterium]
MLSFTQSADSISADGSSQIQLEASVPDNLRNTVSTVYFTATGGSFGATGATVSVAVDTKGKAHASLTAPATPMLIHVTASALSTVMTDTIRAVTALPDTMFATTPRLVIRADTVSTVDTITVSVQLLRKTGTASAGLTVDWAATAANGVKPIFTALTVSSAAGVITCKYSPGLTNYKGPVTVTASTKGVGGTISASTVVYVLPPEQPAVP